MSYKNVDLAHDILWACGGQVVQLPYNEAQASVTRDLIEHKLIYFTYEDDQPTHRLTPAGERVLAALVEKSS